MTLQTRVLAVAVVAALSMSAAHAAKPDLGPSSARAKSLIDASPATAKRHMGDSFIARDVIVDRDGTEHVRFDRTYRGLPVIGGDMVVHSRNGQLKGTRLMLKTAERP